MGNIGLYYVCYELSKLGWNVLPTSRNARGVDVLVYNQSATETHSIQAKALSGISPVPLGNNLDSLIAEYLVICRKATTSTPEIFVTKMNGIMDRIHVGVKDGKNSYWFQPKDYERLSRSLRDTLGKAV